MDQALIIINNLNMGKKQNIALILLSDCCIISKLCCTDVILIFI